MALLSFFTTANSPGSSKKKTKLRIRSHETVAPTSEASEAAAPKPSATLTSPFSMTVSLGTGQMTPAGTVSFVPSPTAKKTKRKVTPAEAAASSATSVTRTGTVTTNNKDDSIKSLNSTGTETTCVSSSVGGRNGSGSSSSNLKSALTPLTMATTAALSSATTLSKPPRSPASRVLRVSCSFLRVADLDMDETMTSSAHSSDPHDPGAAGGGAEDILTILQPNIHHASVDPPPGVDRDPKERWIAFTTDKDGSHAPIAPYAMDRLAHFGLTTSLNETMWQPADYKTGGMLKRASANDWFKATFKPGKVKASDDDGANTDAVLIWSGSFIHGLYGSDLPAIRAAGMVNMSAKALFDLLVDSNRVKEYNKLSLGRTDLVTFDGDLSSAGPFGKSVTKVMRSETRPPIIRKNLVFESILHAKELVDGSGYVIVTRAIHQPGEDNDNSLTSVIKSEILMGVNLIRKVQGHEDTKCCMINVNHIRSPMVPMMVAKRIGVSSAVGFMNDIRSLC